MAPFVFNARRLATFATALLATTACTDGVLGFLAQHLA